MSLVRDQQGLGASSEPGSGIFLSRKVGISQHFSIWAVLPTSRHSENIRGHLFKVSLGQRITTTQAETLYLLAKNMVCNIHTMSGFVKVNVPNPFILLPAHEVHQKQNGASVDYLCFLSVHIHCG